MIRPLNVIAAFAAGAALMYFLDPQQGRRRRALARDKSIAASRDARRYANAKRKLVAGRMHGMAAGARARLSPQPVDDDVLYERIRARLGHVATHPTAVVVAVESGIVRLGGTAPEDEAETLLAAVAAMPGVREVHDEFDDRALTGEVRDAGPWPSSPARPG